MKKENNLYNLMTQLTQEAKSLWRMENEYVKDAAKNPALKKFWAAYAKEKSQHITNLKAFIKKEMK
jgi:hypothetical protein